MQANRAKDTEPELALRARLRSLGLVGYRLNWRGAAGRPDIAFVSRRIAVFVHGCFWHRCPTCRLPLPKSNREFWKAKFRANQGRDRRKRNSLEAEGWTVVEVFECWIRDHPGRIPTSLSAALRRAGSR